MDPKDILKKAQELVDAYKKLKIEETGYGGLILRLVVQTLYPGLTIRNHPND